MHEKAFEIAKGLQNLPLYIGNQSLWTQTTTYKENYKEERNPVKSSPSTWHEVHLSSWMETRYP